MPDQEKKEWVIIFLIYADFRQINTLRINEKTKLELNELFDDLINCKLNNKIDVYIIINRVKYYKEVSKGLFDSRDETFIYQIIKSMSSKNRVDLIERIDNKDPKNPSSKPQKSVDLSNSFTNIFERKNKKIDNLLLVTWDHGSVFGINKEEIEDKNTLEELSPIFQQNGNYFAINDFLNAEDKDSVSLMDVLVENEKNLDLKDINAPIFKLNNSFFSLSGEWRQYASVINKLKSNRSFINNLTLKKTDGNLFLEFKMRNDSLELNNFRSSLDDDELKLVNNISGIGSEKPNSDSQFISVLKLDKPFDILTNYELSEAISLGFEGRMVDVLLMMNCCMMNVHTAYTLQKAVSFLVAPQRGIDRPAYNYKAILDSLANESTIVTPDQLSTYCITTSSSIIRHRHFSEEIEKWSLFAICLKHYGLIADELNNFVGEIIKDSNIDILKSNLKDARRDLFRFDDTANYYLIDFLHWLKEYGKLEPENRKVKEKIHFFQSMLYEITVAKMIGSRKYYDAHDLNVNHEPTSLALYFPERFDLHTKEDEYLYFIFEESPDQCPFIRDKSNWLKFIKLF